MGKVKHSKMGSLSTKEMHVFKLKDFIHFHSKMCIHILDSDIYEHVV